MHADSGYANSALQSIIAQGVLDINAASAGRG